MDLTASILAAAGVTPPASYRPEGVDLIGPLQNPTIVDRTPNAPGAPQQRAVRRGNWKYLQDRGQNFPGRRSAPREGRRSAITG
jgi:hypothetical protein